MICCEKERTTPFCSECGRCLDPDPLDSLLKYIRSEAIRLRESDDLADNGLASAWEGWEGALGVVRAKADASGAKFV